MAISLTGGGISLDYPTSAIGSGNYPTGCVAQINGGSLNGTWIYWWRYLTGSGSNGWDVQMGIGYGTGGRGGSGASNAVGVRIA